MRLDISYKRETIPLDISDERIIKIVEPNDVPRVDEVDVIREGLASPVGKYSFNLTNELKLLFFTIRCHVSRELRQSGCVFAN